jgi:hypothetical protein
LEAGDDRDPAIVEHALEDGNVDAFDQRGGVTRGADG